MGASTSFAYKIALLYVSLWAAGLNPRIARVFSSPDRQQELLDRWNRGDRAGIRVKPADPRTSKHCKTAFPFNRPAATAVDMPCSDDRRGAQIAQSLGIGAGQFFADTDPGHYFEA